MTTPIYPPGTLHWTHRYPDRVARGPAAAGAKLSAAQIDELCERWQSARPTKAWLARRYGVTYRTIHRHLRALGLT